MRKIRKRVKSITSVLLLQLAIADLLSTISFSFTGQCLVTGRKDIDYSTMVVAIGCNIIGWIGNFTPLISIYLVCILSFGRCIAIYRSFDYPVVMSKRNVTIMCLVAWFSAIAIACIPYYGHYHYIFNKYVCSMFVPLSKIFESFTMIQKDVVYFFYMYLGAIIPSFFMMACCIAVIIRLKNKSKNLVGLTRFREKAEEATDHAAKTVFLIVIFFNISFAPFIIVNFVEALGRIGLFQANFFHMSIAPPYNYYFITVVYFILIALSGCINPCIYYLRAKNFRHEVSMVINKRISAFQSSMTRMSFKSRSSSRVPVSPRSPSMAKNKLQVRYCRMYFKENGKDDVHTQTFNMGNSPVTMSRELNVDTQF